VHRGFLSSHSQDCHSAQKKQSVAEWRAVALEVEVVETHAFLVVHEIVEAHAIDILAEVVEREAHAILTAHLLYIILIEKRVFLS